MARILLDCGAFSAFKQGIELKIENYVPFIKANLELLHAYVSLDVIPGTNGQWDTAEQSYEYHRRMKDAGLTPIPVFHQGESWKWLERMLESGEPYLGLSHKKPQSLARSITFFDACFDRLIASGRPLIKTHGFGLTDVFLLHRYPWATADSRTWSKQAEAGQITVPLRSLGKWDHSWAGGSVFMTDRTRGKSRHIDDCAPCEVEELREYLAELGIAIPEARYSQMSRELAQLGYFCRVEESVRARVTSFRHPAWGLRPDWSFEIAYGTDTSGRQNTVLTKAGVDLRLLSFAKLKDQPGSALEKYVTAAPPSTPSKPRLPKRTSLYDLFHDPRFVERRKLAMWHRIKTGRERSSEPEYLDVAQ